MHVKNEIPHCFRSQYTKTVFVRIDAAVASDKNKHHPELRLVAQDSPIVSFGWRCRRGAAGCVSLPCPSVDLVVVQRLTGKEPSRTRGCLGLSGCQALFVGNDTFARACGNSICIQSIDDGSQVSKEVAASAIPFFRAICHRCVIAGRGGSSRQICVVILSQRNLHAD